MSRNLDHLQGSFGFKVLHFVVIFYIPFKKVLAYTRFIIFIVTCIADILDTNWRKTDISFID